MKKLNVRQGIVGGGVVALMVAAGAQAVRRTLCRPLPHSSRWVSRALPPLWDWRRWSIAPTTSGPCAGRRLPAISARLLGDLDVPAAWSASPATPSRTRDRTHVALPIM